LVRLVSKNLLPLFSLFCNFTYSLNELRKRNVVHTANNGQILCDRSDGAAQFFVPAAIVSNANAGMRFIDKGRDDPATLRDILVDVASAGRRAHEIIQNVRNTVKRGDPTRRRIDLNELVAHVAHVVRPDAVAGSCEIETSLAKDLPLVEGDPVQIQQVLINLVSNALDAMRQTPVNERKVEITTTGNGDGNVGVSVRDHGTGIRAEVRKHLFDQFFTTKEQGLGMGLAIVRSIVESHGGKIDAENVSQGGARFYFSLPVTKEA